MVSINQAILKTLLYADIFHFPLTKEEIWTYLVSEKEVQKSSFDKALHTLSRKIIQEESGYVFFSQSLGKLVDREERKKISRTKIRLATQIAYYLSYIPTVQFVGLSGAVAIENADIGDDIDFFLICKTGTVWVSRLCCLVILQLLGRRRSRNMQRVKDMICLNMLIDTSSLRFSESTHSLYLAHEIVQMNPLFSRGNAYSDFLRANLWISSYLPHGMEYAKGKELRWQKNNRDSFFLRILTKKMVLQISKFLQTAYMRRKRKSEIIADSLLAFHPYDYALAIMSEYKKRLQEYGVKESYEKKTI